MLIVRTGPIFWAKRPKSYVRRATGTRTGEAAALGAAGSSRAEPVGRRDSRGSGPKREASFTPGPFDGRVPLAVLGNHRYRYPHRPSRSAIFEVQFAPHSAQKGRKRPGWVAAHASVIARMRPLVSPVCTSYPLEARSCGPTACRRDRPLRRRGSPLARPLAMGVISDHHVSESGVCIFFDKSIG